MSRSRKTRSVRRRAAHRKRTAAPAAIDPLEGLVVECGGELWFPVDFTPGGFPIGMRVEVVDGELRFPDLEDDSQGLIVGPGW
jgi:hypothetical protein